MQEVVVGQNNSEISPDELEMFGLSNYESRAYLELLSSGIKTAKEIIEESRIPYGRIYDVLSSLEDKGLIEIQDSRPKKFIAKEPKVALNTLLTMKKTEVQFLTQKAAYIEQKLSRLRSAKPEESLFWNVALGPKAIPRYLEKINTTENEIKLIINVGVAARVPQKQIMGKLINSLTTMRRNGISVKVLLSGITPGGIEEVYMKSLYPLFELLNQIEMRYTNRTPMPFDIIDGEKVILKILNPIRSYEFLAWIFIWQKKFALELNGQFQDLWASADELKVEIV
jgi:sugar-specific transcriptional regulator TrmB